MEIPGGCSESNPTFEGRGAESETGSWAAGLPEGEALSSPDRPAFSLGSQLACDADSYEEGAKDGPTAISRGPSATALLASFNEELEGDWAL